MDVKKNFQLILNALLGEVKMVSGGYLLECGSEALRQKVLLMDGDNMNGVTIKVSQLEKKWTETNS